MPGSSNAVLLSLVHFYTQKLKVIIGAENVQ